jgi:hypothetical protein
MNCPLCGRPMTRVEGLAPKVSEDEIKGKRETVFFCERHGVLNKAGSVKEKVSEVERRATVR